MGGEKVAIVGAGRLGSLLASRMAGGVRKVIISRQKSRAVALADEVGGVASDQYSSARGCEIILLAVPGQAIHQTVSDLSPFVMEGALIVNLATDVPTAELAYAFPGIQFAAAKLIGDAREMASGHLGVVVIDHAEPPAAERLRAILAPFGPVIRLPESVVLQANTAIAEVLIRAEAELQSRLGGLGLEPAHIRIAIATAGPGILRSVANGDGGPFLTAIGERLRAEGPPRDAS